MLRQHVLQVSCKITGEDVLKQSEQLLTVVVCVPVYTLRFHRFVTISGTCLRVPGLECRTQITEKGGIQMTPQSGFILQPMIRQAFRERWEIGQKQTIVETKSK